MVLMIGSPWKPSYRYSLRFCWNSVMLHVFLCVKPLCQMSIICSYSSHALLAYSLHELHCYHQILQPSAADMWKLTCFYFSVCYCKLQLKHRAVPMNQKCCISTKVAVIDSSMAAAGQSTWLAGCHGVHFSWSEQTWVCIQSEVCLPSVKSLPGDELKARFGFSNPYLKDFC